MAVLFVHDFIQGLNSVGVRGDKNIEGVFSDLSKELSIGGRSNLDRGINDVVDIVIEIIMKYGMKAEDKENLKSVMPAVFNKHEGMIKALVAPDGQITLPYQPPELDEKIDPASAGIIVGAAILAIAVGCATAYIISNWEAFPP